MLYMINVKAYVVYVCESSESMFSPNLLRVIMLDYDDFFCIIASVSC